MTLKNYVYTEVLKIIELCKIKMLEPNFLAFPDFLYGLKNAVKYAESIYLLHFPKKNIFVINILQVNVSHSNVIQLQMIKFFTDLH